MAQTRIEIQNLRGISILAVYLFHLYPNYFKNGFLGVDVFFVISGFLITQQLLDFKNNSLSEYLIEFYFRRVKRIIPAVLSTLIFTLAFTYFLLGIVTFVKNLESATWANVFLANWYFLDQKLDYFASGNLELFQHFWSLAIEEQFYLFWPIVLFFNKRRLILPITIALLSLIYFLSASAPNNFFNLASRVWELLAGALIALFAAHPNSSKVPISKNFFKPWLIWFLPILLIIPVELPANMATIAVVLFTAAALILLSPALKKSLIFWLGEISFSVYLIHFPTIMIYDELNNSTNSIIRGATITAVTLSLSLANYRFVENRFRYRTYQSSKLMLFSSLGILLMVQISLLAMKGYYV